MATLIAPGALQITVSVDNPDRDDLGGLMIWMSTTSGFTPGPANLVYNGPDLLVPVNKDAAGSVLVAGTTYYLVLALYSQIDPDDYDLSTEYSATPTAPTVAADDITPGTVRGSSVVAGSFATKGSTLTAATAGGDATLSLENTADFAASGSAIILSATNDLDVLTYTGKTATTLTGVSGVLAHSDGDLIIPALEKVVAFDKNTNELKIFIAASTTPAVRLGTSGAPGDYVANFGSATLAVPALNAQCTAGTCIAATNESTGSSSSAISGFSVGGAGVGGESEDGPGGSFLSTDGPNLRLFARASAPSGTLQDGDVSTRTGGRVFVYDGSAEREVLKVEGSTFANVATGSTIALTAPPRRYVNTGAAKAALTFNLPASPVDGQPFEICTDNAITTVAIRDSAGVAGNVLNAPTTLAAGGFCKFEYRSSNTTWYRVG